MQYGQYDNDVAFDGKVDGIGKTSEQRSANPSTKRLVLQWTFDDPIIGRSHLVEEVPSQLCLFILIPVERRLNISIGLWVGDEAILDHRRFLPRRVRILCADCAVVGSRRYSASRRSARSR